MTTIAWKEGVLACDKMATASATAYKAAYKLVKDEHYVWAVTGTISFGLKAIAQMQAGEEDVTFKNCTIVRMDLKTGKVATFEGNDVPLPAVDRFGAEGSGADVALGAMAMGATPREAVRIASHWDVNTGFGVQEVVSERAARRKEKK